MTPKDRVIKAAQTIGPTCKCPAVAVIIHEDKCEGGNDCTCASSIRITFHSDTYVVDANGGITNIVHQKPANASVH